MKHRQKEQLLTYKNVKPIAKAVWKDMSMKEEVFLDFLHDIKKEVKKYAKDPECLLKVTSPEVVTSFTNEAFFDQFQAKCPRLSHSDECEVKS